MYIQLFWFTSGALVMKADVQNCSKLATFKPSQPLSATFPQFSMHGFA